MHFNDCAEQWEDVFMTHKENTYDDQFLNSMMNVMIDTTRETASIVDQATPYIMPAWPLAYDHAGGAAAGGFGAHPLQHVKSD